MGGDGGAASLRSWFADDTGGLFGDFARSPLRRDGGRTPAGGRGGALLLRMLDTVNRFVPCAFWSSLLGLSSTSWLMTRPIS